MRLPNSVQEPERAVLEVCVSNVSSFPHDKARETPSGSAKTWGTGGASPAASVGWPGTLSCFPESCGSRPWGRGRGREKVVDSRAGSFLEISQDAVVCSFTEGGR